MARDEIDEGTREFIEGDDEIRAETSTEYNLAITKPEVAKKHQRFISRDLTVSNIPKGSSDATISMANRYVSIILDFVELGLPSMADIYDSQFKANINLLRSIDAKERKIQVTGISRKEVAMDDKVKKKLGV